jgi:hypothetical protein
MKFAGFGDQFGNRRNVLCAGINARLTGTFSRKNGATGWRAKMSRLGL